MCDFFQLLPSFNQIIHYMMYVMERRGEREVDMYADKSYEWIRA